MSPSIDYPVTGATAFQQAAIDHLVAHVQRSQDNARARHTDYDEVLIVSGVWADCQRASLVAAMIYAANDPADAAYRMGRRRLRAAQDAGVVLSPRHLSWLIREHGRQARAELDEYVAEIRLALDLTPRCFSCRARLWPDGRPKQAHGVGCATADRLESSAM